MCQALALVGWKRRRPEGKLEGKAKNLPHHRNAEQLRDVRLWDPFFLTLLFPPPRTRWQGVRPELWLPCRARHTKWVLPAPLSVSTCSISYLENAWRGNAKWKESRKLGLLRCSLMVLAVSDRLNLCQACGMIAAVGSCLHQYRYYGHATCHLPMVSLVLPVCWSLCPFYSMKDPNIIYQKFLKPIISFSKETHLRRCRPRWL